MKRKKHAKVYFKEVWPDGSIRYGWHCADGCGDAASTWALSRLTMPDDVRARLQ